MVGKEGALEVFRGRSLGLVQVWEGLAGQTKPVLMTKAPTAGDAA